MLRISRHSSTAVEIKEAIRQLMSPAVSQVLGYFPQGRFLL